MEDDEHDDDDDDGTYDNNETMRNIFRRFAHMSNVKFTQLWQAIQKMLHFAAKEIALIKFIVEKTLHHFALQTYVQCALCILSQWSCVIPLSLVGHTHLFVIFIFSFSLNQIYEISHILPIFFPLEHIKYFIHEKQDDVWII